MTRGALWLFDAAMLAIAVADPRRDILTTQTNTGSGGYTHRFYKATRSAPMPRIHGGALALVWCALPLPGMAGPAAAQRNLVGYYVPIT